MPRIDGFVEENVSYKHVYNNSGILMFVYLIRTIVKGKKRQEGEGRESRFSTR